MKTKTFDMFRTLKWVSAVIILCGLVCCAWNLSEFNDRNLGLMVGIGFLVGGVQILMIGMNIPLLLKKEEPKATSAEPTPERA